MKFTRLIGLLIGGALLSSATLAYAEVFFTDEFSYENGQLTDNGGAVSVSNGVWDDHSGSSEFLQVVDGKVDLRIAGTEDANRLSSATLAPAGTWYYASRFVVNDMRTATGTIGTNYFMHFKEPEGTHFRGRLYVAPPNDVESGLFTLGISSSTVDAGPPVNGAVVKWAADLSFGVEYTIVVSYTADDDDSDPNLSSDGWASLWVNPATEASTSITDKAPNSNIVADLSPSDQMVGLALRQQNAGNNQPQILIDAVSIGDGFDEVLAAVASGSPQDSADFDGNQVVDGNDFVIWQKGLGAGTTRQTGDANGDGAVDQADLAIWKSQFSGPASLAAVPEPSSWASGAWAIAVASRCWRRRTARVAP